MNSNQIKIIAIIFMAIEHASGIFAELLHLPELNYILHYGGRIVFPIFVFLMVEGFFKTSSRERHLKRIFMMAVIMAAGSLLLVYALSIILSVDANRIFRSPFLLYRITAPIGFNIFNSLWIGLLLLYLIEKFKKAVMTHRILLGIAMVLLVVYSLITEASVHVVPLFLIFYFFYNQKKHMAIAYSLYSLVFLVVGLTDLEYFWSFGFQWMMIFALPIFLLYNGEKGSPKTKYFFYVFYPLHLWIIFVIESLYFFVFVR